MLISGFLRVWAVCLIGQEKFLTYANLPALLVVRLIVLKGSRISQVKMKLLYLVGFAIVLNGATILNYRKTQLM